jgi:hypothetical protein
MTAPVLATEAPRDETNRGKGAAVVRSKWPGRRKRRDYGVTAEEIVRRGTAAFDPSFAALKEAIGRSCSQEDKWEARIVAGIGAVIEFTLEDVEAARALTVCAGAQTAGDRDLEGEMLDYFAELFDDVAPDEMLFPISSPAGIVETTAVVIKGHLLAGRIERIEELGPELVFIALMPYVGFDSAKHWAAAYFEAKR